MTKYKLSEETIPEWLMRLPPGEYTITQIQNEAGLHRDTIYTRLEALAVDKRWVKIENHWKNVYNWKGATFYWTRIYDKKKEKLLKEMTRYGQA